MAWYDRAGNTASGAGKGAAAGAVIGSVVPVIGTGIGAGIGAVAGGIKSYLGAEGKDKYQDFLRGDVKKLQKGKGGLTGAQMNRMAAETQRDVGQQVGALEQDIAQKALTEGGGYGASGSYSNLIKDMTENVGDTVAGARWNLQKASLGMAQKKYDDTMARLNEQRIESDKAAKDAMDYVLGDDIMDTMEHGSKFAKSSPT